MSGSRTGTSTVISLARHICRVVRKFHVADLAVIATPELAAAVAALVVACEAFDASDDFAGQIDKTAPIEDIDIAP